LIVDRVRDGRVVDGHGDLRPEHVYLVAAPKIIDCLEFNAELRAVDVVDELAFLAMESEALHAPWIGEQILERYFAASGDRPKREVVEFFRCYRACVRAKVMLLRSGQVTGQDSTRSLQVARDYLVLADRSAARLGPPVLLVVRGLSGTGKSTLAAALAEELGCRTLSTDLFRQQLFAPRGLGSDYNTGRYAPQNRQRVYDALFRDAAEHLNHRSSVVLDGTFLRRDLRQAAIDLADRHQAVPLIVNCSCPKELAAERVRERLTGTATASEIRPEFLARQDEEDEPSDSSWNVCNVDTSDGIAVGQEHVLERIRQLLFA
jgi:predicted kinase